MPPTEQSRLFARAAQLLGGVSALSDFLHVPQSELMRWIKGDARPTTKAFLDVVDLLHEADANGITDAVLKGGMEARVVKPRR